MGKVSDFQEQLEEMLPRFYQSIKEFEVLLAADASKLAEIDDLLESTVDQPFINTATWGLERWEIIFGIPVDKTKPLEQRRSVIKSKVRGAGVTTVDLIKTVAESWYNGEIDVTEQDLEVIIKFNSNFGVPSNLNDVENALREIIPAHLLIEYLFSYLLIKDIHNVMTLSDFEQLTLNKFAGGE